MKQQLRPAAVVVWAFLITMAGCNNPATTVKPVSDTLRISADESFRPIIDEQVKMYEASFPPTKIAVAYKPEADCLRDFYRDTSTSMVLVTRGLTDKEEYSFKDAEGYFPHWGSLAADAIAILVHKDDPDTLFTQQELRSYLNGTAAQKKPFVFDGLSATSNIRFATDSILRGDKFDTTIVRAAKNSREVIDYVASTPGSVGMVGISWIGNPEDTAQLKLLKKVRIAYVKCDACPDQPYVKPSQWSIMQGRYPLVRALHYISREGYSGAAAGFAAFMRYERGQLIFRRAYLVPLKMDFNVRNIKINETLRKD
jgi:phosphate transport system substrate-binding protein